MTLAALDLASFALAGLTVAGMAQATAGWAAVARFRRRAAPAAPAALPPVTILKPLHGNEPLLLDALSTICAQDYPAFQVIFGIQDPGDEAVGVLRQLHHRFPALDMTVVIDRTQHGANRKIGNLINMMKAAKHDTLLIADSDMHVAPDYLRRVVAALQPGVGLVTSLYAGLPATSSFAARLGTANINHTFLPGALLARMLGRQDCLGATMALTRDTLDSVGGFHALADELADDAVLGQLVRGRGLSVALADTIPATTVPETHMPALFEHELRWARTVKSVTHSGFVASVIQYPLFWAALALGVSGGEGWAWLLFAAAWAVRAMAAAGVDRSLGVTSALTMWCLPFRDLLSMTVILASYRTRRVAWRGQVLMASRPRLVPGKG
ncbi:MAG: bacteriohopanetetrol glucosamine biosynthesis glycosyltransferase HpnI [Janthinobacterium lividum]